MNTQPLSVSLALTPEDFRELDAKAGLLAFVREAFPVVDSAEVAQHAATELKSLKSAVKQIEEKKVGFVRPAKEIIANAEALFDPTLDALAKAIEHVNGGLLAWNESEKLRIEKESREREEAARKAREEADRKAAAARAQADLEEKQRREAAERAEAQRRKEEAEAARLREEASRAEGAEKKRLEAEAKTRDEAARKQAAKQAEEAERANAAQAEGERKAQAIQQQAEAAASAQPEPEATKVVGFSQRKNWIAELDGPTATEDQRRLSEKQTVMKIIEAILLGDRPELIGLITVDLKAAGKMAKALEANCNIPGMRARNVPVGVSR